MYPVNKKWVVLYYTTDDEGNYNEPSLTTKVASTREEVTILAMGDAPKEFDFMDPMHMIMFWDEEDSCTTYVGHNSTNAGFSWGMSISPSANLPDYISKE